ncbi:putative transport protein YdiK [Sphingomonas sp. S2M10]|uniref:AI-2E family transporter n=1 Tax=Sphingomonas sp. S2M10 TaxID=2705010 RepID=UPI00145703F6|nr:AI-2E family transporter [Sphingomonas sp. S2M10]NLS28929.1 putative transport protein YdiK [Sphingomonas sp. S2M10]
MSHTTKAQTRARVVLAAAIAAAALWIGLAFVPAILWAGVLAIGVEPLRLWLSARMPGRPALVAALLTLAILLVVLIPLSIAISQAVIEAQSVAAWIADARTHGVPLPDWVARLPWGREQVTAWWNLHLVTPEAAAAEFGRLDQSLWRSHSQAFTQSLVRRAVVFAFTLVVLFFLLRDRDNIVRQLERGATRAFGDAGDRLGRQIFAAVRGAVDGMVLLGLAQGILMAILFAIGGVPHPILLGLASGFASIIPFGLAVVLVLALLLLLAKGAVMAAIVVGAIGYALNFVVDHFLRPSLIGGTTRLPFVWVLIGILGGVETIGLLGLFVGPAVMAALVLLWREWVAEGDIGGAEAGQTTELHP